MAGLSLSEVWPGTGAGRRPASWRLSHQPPEIFVPDRPISRESIGLFSSTTAGRTPPALFKRACRLSGRGKVGSASPRVARVAGSPSHLDVADLWPHASGRARFLSESVSRVPALRSAPRASPLMFPKENRPRARGAEKVPLLYNPGKGTFADRALGDPESSARAAPPAPPHAPPVVRGPGAPTSRWIKLTLTVGVACLQMASTMALITLNKVLIRDLDFDYAAFVSLLGFTATLMCALVGLRGRFQLAKDAWRRYPGAIVVVGACNSFSAFVGNAVYETTLSFAFIQVIKCFTPVIVLAIGVLVGVERVDSRVAVAVGFVVAGLVMCVEGEMNAEPLGVALVLAGGVSEGLRLACTQLLLHSMRLPVLDGIVVMFPPTVFALASAFVATEYKDMMASGKVTMIGKHAHLFVGATALGVAVNALSVSLVSLTSGLTINLLGHVRNVALVLVGVFAFGDVLSAQEMIGYGVAIFGLVGYTAERNRRRARDDEGADAEGKGEWERRGERGEGGAPQQRRDIKRAGNEVDM